MTDKAEYFTFNDHSAPDYCAKWVKVGDRLPIDHEKVKRYETVEVILVIGGCVECSEFRCGPDPEPWYEFGDYGTKYATHWMPLPDPPR